ncbi:hypothetical protein [Nocardioides sp. AX2bis]|uniref:hypothetical protein n=1 Tax=Nocardioides sp. AX2bis TaxID=2653157 RepID=UPI0012F0E7F4|nr:hypothetical protein [Nocardioides sp. AX2bis]VXB77740.1 conserved hypothetical protein [Nocardioides sp. AX2bis]
MLAIVGAALTVIVVIAAFAVDLGVQRVVRRDMQALADVVALDLAREIDGRTRAQLAAEGQQTSPSSALALSLVRNGDTIGDDLTVTVSWGAWDGETFDATVDPPSAVRVVASATTDFAFAPGEGSATRTAYAEADSTACYRLGSWAAAIRSGDSTLLGPLNSLLGLNLDLLSYRGIAGADLRLAQLAAEPRIGSETRLLSSPIAFGDLVQASIDALGKENSPTNSAAIQGLGVLLRASAGLPAVTVGRALSVGAGDSAALDTNMNVLDILAGSLAVANGRRALEIPNLQLGVPGIGNVSRTTLGVQQGLSLACGTPGSIESRATSSQLDGTLDVDFANLPSIGIDVLGLAKGTLQTTKATGSLAVQLGGATGELVSPPPVTCGDGTAGSPDTFTVRVATALASYRLTSDVRVQGKVQVGSGFLKVDALVDMTVRLTMGTGSGPTGTDVALSIPPNDTVPRQTGGNAVLLGAVVPQVLSSSVDVTLPLGLGISLGDLKAGIVDAVVADLTTGAGGFTTKTVGPLAANIDRYLVGPVARLLGLRLAGADVYAVNAVCANPRLTG